MHKGKKNLVYLTGFMGSGKSTIGPTLANTLGYSYHDIDAEIEKITRKKVSKIFSEQGEKCFREIERTLLHKLSQEKGSVIALGGGTIAREDNLRIIKSSGVLVYLKASTEQIYHRLKQKTDRPLLFNDAGDRMNENELRKRIDILLSQREPFYLRADVIIETDTQCIGLTIDEIVRSISQQIE